MAALQAPRRQMRAGATQAMRDIAEERRRPDGPRRLQPFGLVEIAARSLRHSSSTMSPHRLLLVP